MTLIVSAEGSVGQAVFRGRTYRCAIGRSGISTDKTEGDGMTPVGDFDMIRVLYRPDRGAPAETSIERAPIAATDGWCDAPAHTDYNQQVRLPHVASCESMWRDDGLYDLVVVTSHNSNPVVPNVGSAIFVHIAGGSDYPPTEGCVAFARNDLETILREWVPGEDRLVITQEPPTG